MTAEFRALCHSLGLSAQSVAAIAQVPQRTVRYWFASGEPPAEVLTVIQRLDGALDLQVLRALDFVDEIGREQGAKPEMISLCAYQTEQEWWQAHPEYEGFPIQTHGVQLRRVQQALQKQGIKCMILYGEGA